MNNTETDNKMKAMLKESVLEITDPEFSNIIMKKIMLADRRSFIIKRASFYFLIFITICVAVILIMQWAFTGGQLAGLWLTQNFHFIIPLSILFLLKKILGLPAFQRRL